MPDQRCCALQYGVHALSTRVAGTTRPSSAFSVVSLVLKCNGFFRAAQCCKRYMGVPRGHTCPILVSRWCIGDLLGSSNFGLFTPYGNIT